MARPKDVELDGRIADLVDCGLGRNLTQRKAESTDGRLNGRHSQTNGQIKTGVIISQALLAILPPRRHFLMNFLNAPTKPCTLFKIPTSVKILMSLRRRFEEKKKKRWEICTYARASRNAVSKNGRVYYFKKDFLSLSRALTK